MAEPGAQVGSDIAKQVTELLAAKTGRPPGSVRLDDDLLRDLGLDSLAMAELMVLLEQIAGPIPGEQLLEATTVRDIVRLIAARSGRAPVGVVPFAGSLSQPVDSRS